MQLTLDSIVFADGSKIGPDNSHTGRTAAAWMTAEWKLTNEVSNQDPANAATYLATARDKAFAAVQGGSASAQPPSFKIFSISEVSKSRNLQEAYLKLRSRFAEQGRKQATVSADAVVAAARSEAAQWTGLSNLINRLGNSELAATASSQKKGKGLWEGLEVRPAVLRVGEKYQVRRADFLGFDYFGDPLYDTCNFYYSYGYTDTQDPTCDNTGYVAGGDYFTFIDNLCNETTGFCVQGYLWATSFTGFDSHNVGGNRSYDLNAGVLYQDAYLDYSTSPFFEQYLADYGTVSGVVYGSNYY